MGPHTTRRLTRCGRTLPTLLMAATAVGLLAPIETKPAQAAFPGANGRIAFDSNRTSGPGVDNPTGDFEIFTMNPDGTGIEQLTNNTVTDDRQPAWSADGNWIAYASDDEIYMHTDGYCDQGLCVFETTHRLTTNTADDTEPAFSDDGSQIAFVSDRDGNREIYVMDIDDSNDDGNGDNQVNRTNDPGSDFAPAWSPDGTKIAFTRTEDSGAEIYVMDADGTNPVNLTNDPGALDEFPTWSPDGSRIAFASHRDGDFDIYVMNADGSTPKRLTKNAAVDILPAWSPDGKKIAFANRRGGHYEIYVMKPKPESKRNRPKNLTKNGVHDIEPDWRPLP